MTPLAPPAQRYDTPSKRFVSKKASSMRQRRLYKSHISCADVAIALQQPIEQISIEMVKRRLYFFNRACLQNPQLELIPWLVENHRLMGLVKAVRKRHRDNAKRSLDIWEPALT